MKILGGAHRWYQVLGEGPELRCRVREGLDEADMGRGTASRCRGEGGPGWHGQCCDWERELSRVRGAGHPGDIGRHTWVTLHSGNHLVLLC